mgnify:FL=1
MPQTKKHNHTENKSFRADLIYAYMNDKHISQEKFAEIADIGIGQLKGILNATTTKPPIDVLIAISNTLGVTLDYFCNNSGENLFEKEILDKLGISSEIADLFKTYKTHKSILSTDKKPKDIDKKDYNAILNLLLESKVPMNIGSKSFIEIFNQKVLNLLVCSIVYDTRFIQNFKENFTKLSLEINANKTKSLGNNNIDMTFDEILKSKRIDNMLTSSKNELHSVIDKLLETALKETFDSIKPNMTLF